MRVAITTLGCKVNQYDSATLETRLREQGCDIVPFAEAADVYVVNSCSVTDRADAESRQLARRARRRNAAARVVLTGCFAQTNPGTATIPEVDHVVGLNRLYDLIRAVRGELPGSERVLVNDLRTARGVDTIGAEVFTGQTRAFLKIQEGCDLFCTFCIVPFARGRSRSLPPRAVLDQMSILARRGFREVVLTGVHLGGYGEDLSPSCRLIDLLEMILENTLVPRIRLSSIDPPEVELPLLDLMAKHPSLCRHFHIPVQACDDAVLRRMRRKYDSAHIRDLAIEIRRRLPDAALGTDVIAGFPGETDREFEATAGALDELPFTYFHVFPYSKRTGTTAAKLPDHCSASEIRTRAERLRSIGERKRSEFARGFVGKKLRVLAETHVGERGVLSGYSSNYQRVEFDGAAALTNEELVVDIESYAAGRLRGRMVSPHDGRAA